ncbi:uncharacterized protein LOC103508742 [Diaphorina citri]|uniref:Uncharacterized protein LOC103508742 n=1 Tax=Diaphorina citri TaxID=121845 RepID=A0A1S3D0B1_DIACI|nr:uncharacterized protein LOC103508742 [Diaphorina citri]
MFVVKLCVALCVLLCCEYALGNTLWKIEDVDVNDDIVQHALKTAITQISVGEKAEMKKDFFKKLKAVSAKRRGNVHTVEGRVATLYVIKLMNKYETDINPKSDEIP